MRTTCTHCHSRLEIPDHYAGRTVRCTSCTQEFVAEKATSLPVEEAAPVEQILAAISRATKQQGDLASISAATGKQRGFPPLEKKPDTSLLEAYAMFLVLAGCTACLILLVVGMNKENWVLAGVGIGIALASFLQHSAIQLFCRQSRELQAVREEIRWLIQQTGKGNKPS